MTAPPLDLDLELRQATFAHVARLASAGGGLVNSAQLNEGIRFRGERVPIWNQQKGMFRPAIHRFSTPRISCPIATSAATPKSRTACPSARSAVPGGLAD